jgi:hypothetical protein
MFEELLHLITILAAGVAAGGMLVVWVAIVPTRDDLGPSGGLELFRLTNPRIDRIVPPAVAAGAVAGLTLFVLGGGTPALGLGLLASAFVAAISFGLNVPAERRVRTWDAQPAPALYDSVFRRWNHVHAARTLAAVVAFTAYAVSALAA